jgi:predicted O-methyltransferase YrrM
MQFRKDANLSRLTRRLLEPQRRIKGFANADDAMHFALILAYQTATGLKGDMLEIGTFFGKSTMVLAYFLAEGERLVICDAFEEETHDRYDARPGVQDVVDAIRLAVPEFDARVLDVHVGDSSSLSIAASQRFRFVHVDGGHSYAEARRDLELAASRLLPSGIIAVDDYAHPAWPEVTEAVTSFLIAHPELKAFADLNRWEARGRKLYLVKQPD